MDRYCDSKWSRAVIVRDLTVTLIDLPYEVTRQLTVPQAIRLADLHLVLQAAFGWDNSHMFDFSSGTGRKGHRWFKIDHGWNSTEFDHEIETATLTDVLATLGKLKSFTYAYDMGDNWEHDLRPGTERVAAAGEAVIALHAATGNCPPEDSGGAPGFSYMLTCLDDPTSDEREDYLEWLGDEAFDRSADVAALTLRVAAVARKLAKRYPAAG